VTHITEVTTYSNSVRDLDFHFKGEEIGVDGYYDDEIFYCAD
jgi:hypothetical protein